MKKAVYKQKLIMKKIDAPKFAVIEQITCSQDSFFAASLFWDKDEINVVEHFHVLYMNRANKIIAFAEISRGGIDAVMVDKRIVFSHALLSAATGMILFHNHPSGNLKPSQRDMELTKDLQKIGNTMNITVHDHIILAPDLLNYYSFADEGLMY